MTTIWRRPRLLGLVCGALAVMAGLTYLAAAGAPSRYLAVNMLALALGAAAWVALGRTANVRHPGGGAAVLLLSSGLLATALLGVSVSGASRWIQLGPTMVQTSLVIVPAMVVLFARRPDAVGAVGMVVGAVALALQPDRAMAGGLAAGLLVVAVSSGRRLTTTTAASAAALAFGWTLLSPDRLPAVPFVEQVFSSAFGFHPLAGVMVAAGAALLLAPALARSTGQEAERSVLLAFSACWLVVIAAAALGNYPTPVVGYGGASIVGYLLSVALLPSGARVKRSSRSASLEAEPGSGPGGTLLELTRPRSAARG